MEDSNELLSKRTISRRSALSLPVGAVAGLIAKRAGAIGGSDQREEQKNSISSRPELSHKITLAGISSDQEKENPDIVIASDKVMLSESQFPGIIDLLSKDESGSWEQWNNIVPIAQVGGKWSNAEIDKAEITKKILVREKSLLKVKYDYSSLSNGAHFSLIADLLNGKYEVEFSVEVAPDSAPISHFAIGNYYGLKDEVRYVEVNGQIYDALMYEPPKDGNHMLGKFMRLPIPADGQVRFWGNGSVQYQKFENLTENDELMIELRRNPWLFSQKKPGHNWFETVHLTRNLELSNSLSVAFGIEEQAGKIINK